MKGFSLRNAFTPLSTGVFAATAVIALKAHEPKEAILCGAICVGHIILAGLGK